jgi:thiol-disulfide isomerase/thioredoxin
MRAGVVAAAMLAAMPMATSASETHLRKWVGDETPVLARPDLSGRTIDLKELKGRVVLVNFWATWCDPCRDEMPSFERLRDKLKGKPFEVLTVNYGEGKAKIGEFMRKNNLSLTVLLDPDKEAAAAWKAGGLPMTFLVDARGAVRYSAFGECDWSDGEALRVVEGLVAEAPRAR